MINTSADDCGNALRVFVSLLESVSRYESQPSYTSVFDTKP